MNKPKFTPGPWEASNEFVIAPEFDFDNPDQAAYELSQFGGALICSRLSAPNARLIARAPEMYDLLHRIATHKGDDLGLFRHEAAQLIKEIDNNN